MFRLPDGATRGATSGRATQRWLPRRSLVPGIARMPNAFVDFLQRVQPESGLFQARYLPDGSGVPDARGVELDGLGWALWATAQLAAELPKKDRAAFVQRHRRLVDRSTKAALVSIDNPSSLPPPSADYWEVKETKPTLATAAVLCAGLESRRGAVPDYGGG